MTGIWALFEAFFIRCCLTGMLGSTQWDLFLTNFFQSNSSFVITLRDEPIHLWRSCIHDRANILHKTEENHWALPVIFSLKVSKHSLRLHWWVGKKTWSECLEVSSSLLGLENAAGGCWGCAVGHFPSLIVISLGTASTATLSLLLPRLQLIFLLNLGENSNSFICCQRCFSLGWRRIVKCFHFLKNNLNFGRSSSPAPILWTDPCCHPHLGTFVPSPHFLTTKTRGTSAKKQNKKQPNPKPTNSNTALPVTRCHSGDLKHKLYIFIS